MYKTRKKKKQTNRRGKTRDLIRKIGDIKRIFCPKMGTIKERNGRELVEAEEIEETHRRTVHKRFK